jgi:hypothetical protein
LRLPFASGDPPRPGGETAPLPRGALVVVAVGLVLSLLAALLTVEESEGGARLDWDRSGAIPNSKPAKLGDDGRLQIVDGGIEATRPNASGYSLFRVSATLNVDLGGYQGRSVERCTVRVPKRTVLARTPGKRASYPLPSEDLRSQAVPELSVVRFNAKGTDTVGVEVQDAFDEFTNSPGVKVEWAPYRQGQQTWDWVLAPAERKQPVTLSFATMWRTTATPGATTSCSVKAAAEQARVETSGSLGG